MIRATLDGPTVQLEISEGTKIQINYLNKFGQRKVARIGIGPQSHHYFAYFDEVDVDFEICVDNTGSMYRRCLLELNVHNKIHQFSQPENSSRVLLGFRCTGQRFHFGCPSRDDRRTVKIEDLHFVLQPMSSSSRYDLQQALLPPTSTTGNGQTFEDASKKINEITFKVQYCKGIKVNVITPLGKLISFECQPTIPLGKLKKIIMDKEGIPVQGQCLIFCGKLLYDDSQTLEGYKIQHSSTIQLLLRSFDVSGQNGSYNYFPRTASPSPDRDEVVTVEPFVIEMRLAS